MNMPFLRFARLSLSVLGLFVLALAVSSMAQAGLFSKESGSAAIWREMPAAEKPAGPTAINSDTYVKLAEKVTPSTVSIQTESRPEKDAHGGGQMPPGYEDFEDFFRHFRRFGPQGSQPFRGVGSGFIISPDGYILTNNHVVEGAEKVVVQLTEKRKFDAKVIGRDPKVDVALVKIDTDEQLPFVYLGDSDQVKIGQPVAAIGNPFGVGTTITSGIVSALGRRLGSGPYEDFIQTDASINPGNSGGPLFNIHGEVMGINTMIVSRGGGSVGIGFAIPINLVKSVLGQLKESGHVTRGWIGVQIQSVDEALAAQFGLEKPQGALITDILPKSPAAESELKRGDVILKYNGKEIREMNDLPLLVAQTAIGQKVDIEILRDGKHKTLPFTVGKMPDDEGGVADDHPSGGNSHDLTEDWGFMAQDLTQEMRSQLELDDKDKGAVVTQVQPGSVADSAGLQSGDLILEAHRKKVDSVAELAKILESGKDGSVLLLVKRSGGTHFVVMKKGR